MNARLHDQWKIFAAALQRLLAAVGAVATAQLDTWWKTVSPRAVWRRAQTTDWRELARWWGAQYRTSLNWWIGHLAIALFALLLWSVGVRLPQPRMLATETNSADLQRLQRDQEPPDPATGLHLLAVTPSGDVATSLSEIKALFDHPMIALTDVDPDKHPTIPLQIVPSVPGEFIWFGTQGFRYRFTEPLQPATTYTVTLPGTIRSQDGKTLGRDVSWHFATAAPQIRSASPEPEQRYVPERTGIVVGFTQPLDPPAVEQAWQCRWWDAAQTREQDRTDQTAHRCRWQWTFHWETTPEGGQQVTAVPSAPYPRGSHLEISLPAEIRARQGNRGLAEAWRLPFSVADAFALESIQIAHPYPAIDDEDPDSPVGLLYQSDPPKGQRKITPEKYLQPTGDLCFTFTNPLDRGAFERAVRVVSRDAGAADHPFRPQFYYEDRVTPTDAEYAAAASPADLPHRTGCVTADLQFFRRYELRIAGEFRDRSGHVLSGKDLPAAIPFQTQHGGVEAALNITRPMLSATHLPGLPFASLNAERMEVTLHRCPETRASQAWQGDASCQPEGEEESDTAPSDDDENAPADPTLRTVAIDGEYDRHTHGTIDLAGLYQTVAPGVYELSATFYPMSEITLRKKQKVFGIEQERVVSADPVTVTKTILVTRTMLALKHFQNQVQVWAVDIDSGAALPDLAVQIWSGETLQASGTTNAQGIFSVVNNTLNPQGGVVAVVDDPHAFSIVRDTDTEHILPGDFGVAYERPRFAKNYYLFWHTDRPIYRPAQTVHFGGFLRRVTDGVYTVPRAVTTVPVSIEDPDGTEVWRQEMAISPTGRLSGTWSLGDTTIPRGRYRLIAHLPTHNWRGEAETQTFTQIFYVASYKKPDFKVTVTPPAADAVAGDPLRINANAQYFFGAPLAHATVSWSIRQEGFRFAPVAWPDFTFLDDEAVQKYLKTHEDGSRTEEEAYLADAEEVAAGALATDSASRQDDPKVHDADPAALQRLGGSERVGSADATTLDAAGVLTIRHTPDLSHVPTSQIYTAAVTAQEWGQEVSAVADVKIHKAAVYVGLWPQRRVVAKDAEITCDLVTLTPKETAVPNQTVQVEIFQRDYLTVKKRTDDGKWVFESEPRDTLVSEQSIITDASGKGSVSVVAQKGGAYRVLATVRDAQARTMSAAVQIGVGNDAAAAWPQDGADRLTMLTDQTRYAVGDTAELLLPLPTAGLKALLTVERAGLLEQQQLTLTGDNILRVPIRESYIPNVFVSVLLLNPGKQGPAWSKVGLAELQVAPERKRLTMTLTPDRSQFAPKDRVTLAVSTKDADGRGVAADVIVSVADESVLRLVDYRSPDLVRRFYFPRALGVLTAENMLHYKSGDGGDEPAAQAKKRNKFLDTAFFSAQVRTNARGEATVEFPLPDNITTWVAEAFGITEATQVGSTFRPLKSLLPTFVRPVLPRFLAVDDVATPVIYVENLTDTAYDGSLDIAVQGGARLTTPAQQPIRIAPHDRAAVHVGLAGVTAEAATIRVATKNRSGALLDLIEQPLPMQDRSLPMIFAASGATRERTTQQWTLPPDIRSDRGGLTFRIGRAPWSVMQDALQALLEFPYGCAEQRASAAFGMALLHGWLQAGAERMPKTLLDIYARATKQPGAEVTEATVAQRLARALVSLYPFQLDDGGFVFWREDADPDPLLSADLARLLAQLQARGVAVADQPRDRLIRYLSALLTRQRALGAADRRMTVRDKNNAQVALDSRAYLAWGLASLDPKAARPHLDTLLAQTDQMGVRGVASLLQALRATGEAVTKEDRAVRTRLIAQLLRMRVRTDDAPRIQYWRDSQGIWDDRTATAVALQAVAGSGETDALADGTAYLLRHAKHGFGSTHATREGLLALAALAQSDGQTRGDATPVRWSLQKTAEEIAVSVDPAHWFTKTVAMADLERGAPLSLEIAPAEGSPALYYQAELTAYYPMANVPRREDGLILAREWFALDDLREAHPLTKFQLGQSYKATLTLLVPTGLSQVAVEHLLPAGFEPVDFGLTTSNPELQRALADAAAEEQSPVVTPEEFGHIEIQDDRVMWSADYVAPGMYKLRHVARAATVGTFQAPGAAAYPFYTPDIFARSRSLVVDVTE